MGRPMGKGVEGGGERVERVLLEGTCGKACMRIWEKVEGPASESVGGGRRGELAGGSVGIHVGSLSEGL